MSRYQGGMIGSVANTPSGTAYTGRANGVFPLPQQIVAKSSSLWAIGQTVPNAPTIGTATGNGSTSISVAFIPPVQNGGSSITSYTVTSSGGQTATGASSPIVVSGLTTSTAYTFTVTATNAVGTSISSGTSNSTTPAITDPYFSSVSLLLNGDGTNGSQVFTDLSNSPKTITTNGNAQISTSTKKYGTGAMYFDGAGDYLSTPSSSGFNFGTSNFTLELFLNVAGVGSGDRFIIDSSNAQNILFRWASGGELQFYAVINGSVQQILSAPKNLIVGTWYHLAVVRSGSNFYLYVNGINVNSSTNTGSLNTTNTVGINIGGQSSGDYFNGYIDDLRITKGVARYTTNFTPPTSAFPTS
jgi:hypothetical protein